MQMVNAPVKYIAVENPVGKVNSWYRKPDQIIQPYQFGHVASKRTCLWLKGLPKLKPTKIVEPIFVQITDGRFKDAWFMSTFKYPPKIASQIRSQTFQGIADAMADQWGDFLLNG
jgi:hypothetical protein